jgi:hypothetical protein
MVVVSLVYVHLTHSKILLEHVKTLDASRTLCHRKLMPYLVTSFASLAAKPRGLTDEVDRKASLAIDKTGNPTNFDQPFLLIFRS